MNEDDEMLDVVDSDDQVIGKIRRGDSRSLYGPDQGKYIRYASCLLQNSEGKFWIPTRTANKKIAPNGLDFSTAEHVQAGETYLQAIIRGLNEELNLSVSEADVLFIGSIPPDETRRSFSSVYVVKQDVAPDYNKDDFVSYQWLSANELLEILSTGVEAKYDLAPAIRLFGF